MPVNEAVLSRSVPALERTIDTPVTLRHMPVLDGVRAIAILTVMAYHLQWLVPEIGNFTSGGFLGVDIFFVLSGFLITSVLLKEQDRFGSISLKNFFIRRFLRLAPAFWAFLVVLYFCAEYVLPADASRVVYGGNNFLYAFLYLTNWHVAAGAVAGNLNHTWSLAIEEQFYLLWSVVLCLAFIKKLRRSQIAGLTILILSILTFIRIYRAVSGEEIRTLYYSTESRIDGLLFGCVASMFYCWKLVPDAFFASRGVLYSALALFLISLAIFFRFDYTDISLYCGPLSVFECSVAVMILWLVSGPRAILHTLLEAKPMIWIGNISYALYLWHYAVFEFAKGTFRWAGLQIGFAIAISFVIASASYYLIEKPFLKLKDRMQLDLSKTAGK